MKMFRGDMPAKLRKSRLHVQSVVEEAWPLANIRSVAQDGTDIITVDEFCRSGGLADLILARFNTQCGAGILVEEKAQQMEGASSDPASFMDSSCTDVLDGGLSDRPLLARRPSLGFASKYGGGAQLFSHEFIEKDDLRPRPEKTERRRAVSARGPRVQRRGSLGLSGA